MSSSRTTQKKTVLPTRKTTPPRSSAVPRSIATSTIVLPEWLRTTQPAQSNAQQLTRQSVQSLSPAMGISPLSRAHEQLIAQYMTLVEGTAQQKQWMQEDLRYVLARDTTQQASQLLKQALTHGIKIQFKGSMNQTNMGATYNPTEKAVTLSNTRWNASLLTVQALKGSKMLSVQTGDTTRSFKERELDAAIRTHQLFHELGHATVRNNAAQDRLNQGVFTEEIAVDFIANDITRKVFPTIPLQFISAIYEDPRKMSAHYSNYYQQNTTNQSMQDGSMQFRKLYDSDAFNVFDQLNFSAFDTLIERATATQQSTTNTAVSALAPLIPAPPITSQDTFNQLAKTQQMSLLRNLLQASLR